MGTNNKLVWAAVSILGGALIIIMINVGNKPASTPKAPITTPDLEVKPVQIDGDNIEDSLTLVTKKYSAQETKINDQEIKILGLENLIKKNKNSDGTAKISDPRVDGFVKQMNQMSNSVAEIASQFSLQQQALNTTTANGYRFSDDQMGWGDSDKSKNKNSKYKSKTFEGNGPKPVSGYVIVDPMSTKGIYGDQTVTKPSPRKPSLVPLKILDKVSKHLTIPKRSTLLNSVSMTSLIGSVPVNGKIRGAFNVKIIVGENNLATNGLKIPGLKGAVFDGLATGNWNLSCVTVDITGGTFTFSDGRVQHLEIGPMDKSSGSATSASPFGSTGSGKRIGYISNPQGLPCIPGKRISDAPKQMLTMGILGAGANYLSALGKAEATTSYDVSSGRSSETVTGDKVDFAKYDTGSDIIQTMTQFVGARLPDSFDVIYAPAGTLLSIHIEEDLYIDYHTSSRKLVYSGDNGSTKTLLD